VFVEEIRNNVLPNITAWFVKLANNEHLVKVYGRTLLCKVPQKAPKVEKAKEEAKKKEEPKKKEEKPEGQEGEDEEAGQKKKKNVNPLDALPPSSFVLDEFKREFLNSTDKPAVLNEFWKKFDAEGYSLWWMQYQKLASEGKILFKTCNSASFFLQKADPLRKYAFSVHGVYGTEGNYEIRGVWMWRGTDIPEELKSHDSFPYMTIKKLDSNNEADRNLLNEYWLNLEPGQIVEGLPVAETVYFK
jgi:elongation factor 1-gamma